MFLYTLKYIEDYKNVKLENKYIVNKILLFTKKEDYIERINNFYRHKRLNIENKEFSCHLNANDSISQKSFFHVNSLSELPKKKVLLWVNTCKTKNNKKVNTLHFEGISWHFTVVENNAQFSKHKGIINKLDDDEIIISAGELLILKNRILWNNSTGTMYRNIRENKRIIKDSFREKVILPMLQNSKWIRPTYKLEYYKDIIKDYTYKPDIQYMKKMCNICTLKKR